MKEQEQKPQTKNTGGDGFGDAFSGSADATAKEVMVGSGVYLEKLPVSGKTVAEIRDTYSERMDIDDGAEAFIDGKKAAEDAVIKEGQVLRFAHKAGEKG